MTDQKVSLNYVLTGVLAVILTWTVHEFFHWLTSEWLGYDTAMYLNGTKALDETPGEIHRNIISTAGPIITIVQGLVFFFLLKANWNKLLYPFLFTAFYMRLLAGLMNFINPNDEGRIGKFLGIGMFTLPILVSGLLFFLVYRISREHELSGKFQFATTLVVMVASSALIMADQFLKIRII